MSENTYLIISDIHGARSGALAAKEAFSFHHADWILCPGDILYHGPRNDIPSDYAPKEVIEIMNSMKDRMIAVRGNCEAEVDQMVLRFACMSDSAVLPYGKHRIFLTHGHLFSPDSLPDLSEGDIFISGHTHIPAAEKKEYIYLLNPGSVSIPKGGHPATYGLIHDSRFTVYTLDHRPYMEISLSENESA